VDPVTGEDYSYRRQVIRRMEEVLACLFGVEVCFHAEMSNHLHLILRTCPDVVRRWSDREVVRRWLTITKLRRNGTDQVAEPTEARMAQELKNPARVRQLRRRLADISWFMGALCEGLSRRFNRESGSCGAFWEHRFKCRCLIDEASILVCGMYVDLNPIRAGEAQTPEAALHTSACDRIRGLRHRRGRSRESAAPCEDTECPDGWLAELSLPEAGRGQLQSDARSSTATGQNDQPRRRASNCGLLPMSLESYLELLDWTGRRLQDGKHGAIPAHLAPILQRLGIVQSSWLDAVAEFPEKFGLAVGSCQAVAEAAQALGRRWFRGKGNCASTFGSGSQV
jgi:hypothetical protein